MRKTISLALLLALAAIASAQPRRHDPKVEPNRGWDADALQVRLCSDPKAAYPLAGKSRHPPCGDADLRAQATRRMP